MEAIGNITKQHECKMMSEMLREREAISPSHRDPNWAHRRWGSRKSEHTDIKRVLGVGIAKMTDHLRGYKDPFEPN